MDAQCAIRLKNATLYTVRIVTDHLGAIFTHSNYFQPSGLSQCSRRSYYEEELNSLLQKLQDFGGLDAEHLLSPILVWSSR